MITIHRRYGPGEAWCGARNHPMEMMTTDIMRVTCTGCFLEGTGHALRPRAIKQQPPDDLALHPGCGLTPPCASQAEMRERHGTPAEFAAAVWGCPDISGAEAQAAAERYERAYRAAGAV